MNAPPVPVRGLPYGRLSGFYFCYFAALGAFMPYWALYLGGEGYTPAQIGQLMALFAATKLVAPNGWGWLADRTDRSVLLIRLTSLMSALGFFLVDRFPGMAWMLFASLLVGLFWNAPLPLFEAVTLSYLKTDTQRYSRIRLWGSVGFIAAVLAMGRALDSVLAVSCVPLPIVALLSIMTLFTLVLPERSVRSGATGRPSALGKILKKQSVLAFFVAVMLIQAAHAPHYVFFSVYLKQAGYDSGQTGMLWSLGVLAEVMLFLFLHQFLGRHSLKLALMLSAGLGVLRWLLIGWLVDQLAVVIFAQLLHAATFGASHVAAIHLVHRYFAGAHHGKGQSLYSSLSYGLGGTLGSYLAGALWAPVGPGIVYSLAALASAAALLIVWLWVDGNSEQPDSATG